MIILGDRYSFSRVEKERLAKKFKDITHISYRDLSATETIKRLKSILDGDRKTIIILNTKANLQPELLTYLTELEIRGVEYITIERFLENYLNKCLIEEDRKETSSLKDIKGFTTWQYIQKRVVDYIGVMLLLIPTTIAIVYSKYRIKKESAGSLFFRQLRVGKDGKEFECIKLRSMSMDAERDGAKFATDNDPRAFPWGKIIRDKKIDELIQIWNVLKGEMHLVGPRPERRIWTREFEKSIPYYKQRETVAPGITGLAQIKYQYGSGKLDAKEKLMYDLYYIKNWSIWLEFEIIYKTAIFILTKKKRNLSNF